MSVSLLFDEVRLVLVGLRTEESEEMLETLSGRPMVEWAGVGGFFIRSDPIFANRKCVVTIVAKNFRDCSCGGRHSAVPAGKSRGHNRVGKSGFVHGCAVTARQQR